MRAGHAARQRGDRVTGVQGYGVQPVPEVDAAFEEILRRAGQARGWEDKGPFGNPFTPKTSRAALEELATLGHCEVDHAIAGGDMLGLYAVRCDEGSVVIMVALMVDGVGNVTVRRGGFNRLARHVPRSLERMVPASAWFAGV